jgi:uncharacterized membrane protein
MQSVPDWAPNIHPMIVHFPLVLLILAVLFDLIGLFSTKFEWIKKSSLLLYFLGTIAAIVAFLTGNTASDSIDIPSYAFSAVNDHADWAEITLLFFTIYTIIRLGLAFGFKSKPLKKIIITPFVLTGLLGIYFLYQTGDHGARLVFGYGLGTGNIIKSEDKTGQRESEEYISDSTFTVSKDGSWKLIADAGVIKVLSETFNWIEGSIGELSPRFDPDEAVLMFHQPKEAMFIYNNKIKSVQVTAKIKIDDFKGEFELVHHFINKNNYDFLGLKNREISLSRKINREIKIFGKDKFQSNGWIELKVVSDGTHFRGYVNNKLMVHGHDSEPETGSVGIKISGNGSVSLKRIETESLKN